MAVNLVNFNYFFKKATVTNDFLDYTKAQGNDLSTPRGSSFPGLKAGDNW